MKTILFVDGTCPKSYDPGTLATEGMGGTEATVIRIAEGLAATGLFSVYVEQHNSEHPRRYGAVYCAAGICSNPDYVISLRYPPLLALMQKRFPNAKHYLWHHDLLQPSYAEQMVQLSDYTAIAVSNYHKNQMQTVLGPQGYGPDKHFPIKVCYNPIADDLQPDETPVDRNKLVWTASPHKGLDHALSIFNNLRSFNRDFTLYVSNPGYLDSKGDLPDGVISLGKLPHRECLQHVRSALALWYPNPVFPETFGLILAEANSVGTPVLAHRFGAAPEVTYHPYELLDCRNTRSVIDRVMSWYNGDRPRVKGKKEFRLSSVIETWKKVLGV